MRKTILTLFYVAAYLVAFAQNQPAEKQLKWDLAPYFEEYEAPTASIGKCKIEKVILNNSSKSLFIYADAAFSYQPFTPIIVDSIYTQLQRELPAEYKDYKLQVITDGLPIEELITNGFGKKIHNNRLWHIDYKGDPWTRNLSRAHVPSKGLEGRHIALWQSHGIYYSHKKRDWIWQRPYLFGTTEDMFTQTFVTPFLIPMLENAGAVVFTPRERDWQRNEAIVDNDGLNTYNENGKGWKASKSGFALKRRVYQFKQNPFRDGTSRYIGTAKQETATAEWIPDIKEAGRYAVYISYQSFKESVSDAHYKVIHQGRTTEFAVNQQMGGGTWVYLGTFYFDKGSTHANKVVLSNASNQKGVVSADAVRFGGGMGNMARGGRTSGQPRFMEGARYYAQWAGMHDTIYSPKNGRNDYPDDINARSKMVNYLSGGSIFNPKSPGIKVPFELSLALHSDAGYRVDPNELLGTLGVYTTKPNHGMLSTGVSRFASRDLLDRIITGLQQDISLAYGTPWARRSMWDRNYSETRIPEIPSVIIELLAHQNFADMKYGHDPKFKFLVGRSIYKSILKYTAFMHQQDYVVQPLPVKQFAITLGDKKNSIELSWEPTDDPFEPTAKAKEYIVYTRMEDGAFDNGIKISHNRLTIDVAPDNLYSFKVTAVNEGGESFPSEVLTAYIAEKSKGTVLAINGFHRLSAPHIIETDTTQGFDLLKDPGMAYINTPAFTGPQTDFRTSQSGWTLGDTSNEWEGRIIAGNTFDYTIVHAKAVRAMKEYSFVSCSDDAFEANKIKISPYFMIDWIGGAERKAISLTNQQKLRKYCNHGGKILISGAHVVESLEKEGYAEFCDEVLKCRWEGLCNNETGSLYGLNQELSIHRELNEQIYSIPDSDVLTPVDKSYAVFLYTPQNYCAATVYNGKFRTYVLGFPLENIREEAARNAIMNSAITFFR